MLDEPDVQALVLAQHAHPRLLERIGCTLAGEYLVLGRLDEPKHPLVERGRTLKALGRL